VTLCGTNGTVQWKSYAPGDTEPRNASLMEPIKVSGMNFIFMFRSTTSSSDGFSTGFRALFDVTESSCSKLPRLDPQTVNLVSRWTFDRFVPRTAETVIVGLYEIE
jgi:hypothetical protein